MTRLATYHDVNDAWQRTYPLPPITRKAAVVIARKLAKKYAKAALPWWLAKSSSWANTGAVNHAQQNGLQRMVHDVSHWSHQVRHRNKLKSHSGVHAALELAMIQHVIAKGWHIPKSTKPKVLPLAEKRAKALAASQAMLGKWQTKLKLATTKVRKYKAEVKRRAKIVLSNGGGD